MENDILKSELNSFVHSKDYEYSLRKAHATVSGLPDSRDLNPIIQKVRSGDLTDEEKLALVKTNFLPSPPRDIIHQWIAPAGVSIKRDKQWFINLALMTLLIIIFGLLVKSAMIVAVILSIAFALYVSSSVPAPKTLYKITKQGIEIGSNENIEIFPWEYLLEYAFYFKEGQEFMYIYTIIGFPKKIQVLYSQEDRKFINMIMELYLPYKKPPKKQGFFSRLVDGMYIPIEEFKALQEKIDNYYNIKYANIISNLKSQGAIPQDVTVEDIRKFEEMERLKIIDSIKGQKVGSKDI